MSAKERTGMRNYYGIPSKGRGGREGERGGEERKLTLQWGQLLAGEASFSEGDVPGLQGGSRESQVATERVYVLHQGMVLQGRGALGEGICSCEPTPGRRGNLILVTRTFAIS